MSTLAKLTVTEYEKIVASGVFDGSNQRRIELIWGELRSMNPIGSEHAMVVDRLAAWSFSAAPRESVWVRIQNPVAFLDCDSEPEPDIVWAKPQDYTARHPAAEDVLLLIEVAESSLEFDLGEKAVLYATAGIAEYWVVDLVERKLVVHRDSRNGVFNTIESFGRESTVSPRALPIVRLQLQRLFRSGK